jgi:hypothetical protein
VRAARAARAAPAWRTFVCGQGFSF